MSYMSHFRIQRKLTEGSAIKLRPTPSNPTTRIKSLESKHSFSRSPHKSEPGGELGKLFKNLHLKQRQRSPAKAPNRSLQDGIKAYQRKQAKMALQIFREVRKRGERSAELCYYTGSCLLNLGQHQSSIVQLNQCITLNHKYSPSVYLLIAINFKMLGNVKQAIRVLDQGEGIFPSSEEILFYKGKLQMKSGQHRQAVDCFMQCLKNNPHNQLATLFLGDCLKATGAPELAQHHYTALTRRGKQHKNVAVLRLAGLLVEGQKWQLALKTLEPLQKSHSQHPELNYCKGVSCLKMGHKQQGTVYLQSSISHSQDVAIAGKALIALVLTAIEEGNFYQAEHHISRVSKMQLDDKKFSHLQVFVEGVNDLIKKRNGTALKSLQKALDLIQHKHGKHKNELKRMIEPYLAYALYLNGQLRSSHELYTKLVQSGKEEYRHEQQVIQGLYEHEQKQHPQACRHFEEAYEISPKPQCLMMATISLIQEYKRTPHESKQEALLERALRLMERGSKGQQLTNLFMFYYTLLLQFAQKPSLSTIEEAIRLCDEPISEYYFIQALSMFGQGKTRAAIQSISRAIDLDPSIEQFYRDRSKYYFLVEDYPAAIRDCNHAQELAPQDSELPLLLSFYHYLQGHYVLSQQNLDQIEHKSPKLDEFQQALDLRLGRYDSLRQVGEILHVLGKDEAPSDSLLQKIYHLAHKRIEFSQFSVYFYKLLLAVGHCLRGQPIKALDNLMGCLEEVQQLIGERERRKGVYEVTWEETQQMLDQIKFNIVVVTLMKEDISEAVHQIELFLEETASPELKETLVAIMGLLGDERREGETVLMLDDTEQPRLSDSYRTHAIPVNRQTITTKLLVSYPIKLKFNIQPEFDPNYLLNFDIDKIDYKLSPPWMAFPLNRPVFTSSLAHHDPLLLDTPRTTREHSSVESLRNNLRLDSRVEQRLHRLMKS